MIFDWICERGTELALRAIERLFPSREQVDLHRVSSLLAEIDLAAAQPDRIAGLAGELVQHARLPPDGRWPERLSALADAISTGPGRLAGPGDDSIFGFITLGATLIASVAVIPSMWMAAGPWVVAAVIPVGLSIWGIQSLRITRAAHRTAFSEALHIRVAAALLAQGTSLDQARRVATALAEIDLLDEPEPVDGLSYRLMVLAAPDVQIRLQGPSVWTVLPPLALLLIYYGLYFRVMVDGVMT